MTAPPIPSRRPSGAPFTLPTGLPLVRTTCLWCCRPCLGHTCLALCRRCQAGYEARMAEPMAPEEDCRQPRPDDVVKRCRVCGALLARRPGERRWSWLRRTTCNRACGRQLQPNKAKPISERWCRLCGALLVRKRHGRHRELRRAFLRRQTCGLDCPARKMNGGLG